MAENLDSTSKINSTPDPSKLISIPAPSNTSSTPASSKMDTTPAAPSKTISTTVHSKISSPSSSANVISAPAPSKINSMPTPILERIFRLLSFRKQLDCETVCSTWRKVLQSIWSSRNGVQLELVVVEDEVQLSILQCTDCINVDVVIKYKKSILDWVFKKYGGQIKFFRIQNTTTFDITFFTEMHKRCPNLETIWFSNVSLEHPKVGKNKDLPTLASLVSISSLRSVVLKKNSAIKTSGCAKRRFDWQIGLEKSKDTIDIYPIRLPKPLIGLVKLWLENVKMSGDAFVKICEKLGPTLQYLCLKNDYSMIDEAFLRGLAYLTELVHLNLGGSQSCHAEYLGKEHLRTISDNMKLLENVSFRDGLNLTSADINVLLNSACGSKTLRYLNLVHCPKVGSAIENGIDQRPPDAPLLTIFSDINPELAEQLSCRNCTVEVTYIDQSVFWGEENCKI